MSLTFAYGRETLNNSDWTITTTSGGSLTAGSYRFCLQGVNNFGKNLPLISNIITVTTNQKIVFTINSTAKKTGEGWLYFSIGINSTDTTNDVTKFYAQIAKIPLYNFDGNGNIDLDSPLTFPLTLELTTDSQLKYFLDSSVLCATLSNLPTTNLKHGMIRRIVDLTTDVEYNPFSIETVDNINVFSATTGRWIKSPDFSKLAYLADIKGLRGCAQDVRNISDTDDVEVPSYYPDGYSSEKLNFWIVNDSDDNIAENTRIGLSVFIAGTNKSDLFDKKIVLINKGFVDTTTGVLRNTFTDLVTPLENINLDNFYESNNSQLYLEDVCLPGEAIWIQCYTLFSAIEFDGMLPSTFIKILPELISSVGVYNGIGDFLGDGLIFNTAEKRRIVPDLGLTAIALSGSGIVKSFSFPELNKSTVSSFITNTINQKVLINKNGTCYTTTLPNPADTVQRALVSTLSGESIASAYSSYLALTTSQGLQITATYPCNASGYGTIRSNYPDVIAGSSLGKFNPLSVNFYVQRQSDSQIRKFTGFTVVPGVTQVFNITNWTSGTVVGSIPSTEFGLFKPTSNSTVTTSGTNFTATNYRVAYSFVWNGNQITDISHSENDGNIPEATIDITDLFIKYWLNPIATLTELRDLLNPLDRSFIWCHEIDKLYVFDIDSTATDNATTIIEPTVGVGAWLEFSSGSNSKELTTNLTLYASTSGSDLNDGLTVGTPMTITGVLLKAATYQFNNFTLTIQLADGTYASAITLPFITNGNLIIQGNNTTPDNVILSGGITLTNSKGSYRLKDFKLAKSGAIALSLIAVHNLIVDNIYFGACATGINAVENSIVKCLNLSVTTNPTSNFIILNESKIVFSTTVFHTRSATITLPVAFIVLDKDSTAVFNGSSTTGTINGIKFNVKEGSYLYASTGTPNSGTLIPGNTNGTFDNYSGFSGNIYNSTIGLTSNITWFCKPTGSGTQSGVDAANAKTFSTALLDAEKLISNGFELTLTLVSGTYTESYLLNYCDPQLFININTTGGSPSSFLFSDALNILNYAGFLNLTGVRFSSSSRGIYLTNCSGIIDVSNSEFYNSSSTNAFTCINSNLTIGSITLGDGTNLDYFLSAKEFSNISFNEPITIAFGTSNIIDSAFILCEQSRVIIKYVEFTGTFTGNKFEVKNGGYIKDGSGDIQTLIPGTINGTFDNYSGFTGNTGSGSVEVYDIYLFAN